MKRAMCLLLSLMIAFSIVFLDHSTQAETGDEPLFLGYHIVLDLPKAGQVGRPIQMSDVSCEPQSALVSIRGWYERPFNNPSTFGGIFVKGNTYYGYLTLRITDEMDVSMVVIEDCEIFNYSLSMDSATSLLVANITFSYKVTEEQQASFARAKISIVDEFNNGKLSGSSCQLLSENKQIIAEWQSTSEYTYDLFPGTYYVRIVKPTDGYLYRDDYKFTVTHTSPSPSTILTQMVKVPLRRTSVILGFMHDSQLCNGIQYSLLNSSGAVVSSHTSNGFLIHEKLTVNTPYTIRVDGAGNYLIPDNHTFTIGSYGELTFDGRLDSSDRMIVDLEEPYVNVIFKDNNTSVSSVKFDVYDAKGKLLGTYTSRGITWISLTDINSTHTIRVREANGYFLPQPASFSINNRGTVSAQKNCSVDLQNNLVINLTRVSASLVFSCENQAVSGVSYTILDSTGKVVGNYTSAASNNITGIETNKNYTIRINSAEGYVIPAEHHFSLNNEGKLTFDGTVNDRGQMVIDMQKLKATLSFVYQNKSISNIKFTILNGNQTVGTYTSSKNTEIKDLKAGVTYTIRVDKADGYIIPDKKTFTIDNNGVVSFGGKALSDGHMVINLKKVIAQIVFLSNGQEVNDITFDVLSSDGKLFRSYEADGSKTIEGIDIGEVYTIHVTDSGYYNVPADETFSIDAGGKLTYSGQIDERGRMIIELYGDYEYSFTEGANATWIKGSKKDLKFTVKRSVADNLTFGLFDYISIDNHIIDKNNYEVKEGSLRITLKASYLETLKPGEHKLAVYFRQASGNKSDKITTSFIVSASQNMNTDFLYNTLSINTPLILSSILAVAFAISRKLWSH